MLILAYSREVFAILPNELLELANSVCKQKAESQTVECKAARVDCPKRLYDTLSSFSNQDSGGVLLFGIDETIGFQVVGVYDAQDLQKKVTEQCNQMEPPVRAVFTLAETDGKWICAAEIPAVDLAERPCYYRGAGRIKGSYVRVGDADLPMTDYELYSYEAFRHHLHDDERPVERADLAMLDTDKLERYILQRRADRPGFAQLSRQQTLEMLNITRNEKVTLAAVLNFCLYPQGYFPQLGVTAVVVPGTQIGDTDADAARFIDNKRIEGTIDEIRNIHRAVPDRKRCGHVPRTVKAHGSLGVARKGNRHRRGKPICLLSHRGLLDFKRAVSLARAADILPLPEDSPRARPCIHL